MLANFKDSIVADAHETPEQLLLRLKRLWAKPILRGQIHDKKLKTYIGDKVEIDNTEEYILDIVLQERISPTLDKKEAEIINNVIAFGILDTPTINATCVKNANENYAILLNRGLLAYISAFVKYSLAFLDTSQVAYCESVDVNYASPEMYSAMLEQMVDAYRNIGVPVAPFLRLNTDGLYTAGLVYTHNLVFIIAHELTHFLNGDFRDDSGYTPLKGVEGAYRFDGDQKKKQELMADIRAYSILRNSAQRRYESNFAEADALGSILILFDAISRVNEEDSTTHPSPKDRINNIIRQCYDDGLPKGYSGPNLPL